MSKKYTYDAQGYAFLVRDEIEGIWAAAWSEEEREEREEMGEAVDLWDYLRDVLDVDYTIDSNGELIGSRWYVTLGGPTCWIDTRERAVMASWGNERGWAALDPELCEEIDEMARENLAALMDARSTGRRRYY